MDNYLAGIPRERRQAARTIIYGGFSVAAACFISAILLALESIPLDCFNIAYFRISQYLGGCGIGVAVVSVLGSVFALIFRKKNAGR